MKTLLTVALTLLVAVPLTARATTTERTYYLNRGDSAVVTGSSSPTAVPNS